MLSFEVENSNQNFICKPCCSLTNKEIEPQAMAGMRTDDGLNFYPEQFYLPLSRMKDAKKSVNTAL